MVLAALVVKREDGVGVKLHSGGKTTRHVSEHDKPTTATAHNTTSHAGTAPQLNTTDNTTDNTTSNSTNNMTENKSKRERNTDPRTHTLTRDTQGHTGSSSSRCLGSKPHHLLLRRQTLAARGGGRTQRAPLRHNMARTDTTTAAARLARLRRDSAPHPAIQAPSNDADSQIKCANARIPCSGDAAARGGATSTFSSASNCAISSSSPPTHLPRARSNCIGAEIAATTVSAPLELAQRNATRLAPSARLSRHARVTQSRQSASVA